MPDVATKSRVQAIFAVWMLSRGRIFRGRFHPFNVFDEEGLQRRFRLGHDGIMYIVDVLDSDLMRPTRRNHTTPVVIQVLLVQKFFATGTFLITAEDFLHLHESTALWCVRREALALAKQVPHFIHWCSTRSGILNVIAKWPGSIHDSYMLSQSSVGENFTTGAYGGLLVGDSGYPCTPWLMGPFRSPTTPAECAYNQTHATTRSVVERSEELNITGEAADPVAEPKFIVTLSRLLQLLAVCSQCLSPTTAKISRQGPLLRAVVTCAQGHKFIWESQPRLRSSPLLTLLLCGAITFSGASPTCVLRLLSLIGIAAVQKSQYFKIQSTFLFPAALKVWKAEQAQLVQGLQGKTLCLARVGRADSSGYSTKYGTYSLMEMNVKRIIHFELVQSTEVKSSSHMEKEGLRRTSDNMLNQGLIVGTLVTDCHIGVKAMMKTEYPDTKHHFDPWHLAKGKAILEVIFETKVRQIP
ncbi:hypothetical protein ISCGN_008096 [Ixodes scapularis]